MLKNHFTSPRFKKLFNVLMTNVHFLGIGPPTPPWGKDDYEADDATIISKKMRKLRYLFPASYQSTYVDKAIRKFESVRVESAEALAGAVTNHDPKSSVRRDIRRLVAVISNIHRSFLDEGKHVNLKLKKPSLPPLAAFIHDPLKSEKITAFTIVSTDISLKLLGTAVPVVSLPSSYRNDLLLWGVLTHETCGHPILHAFPNLLKELSEGIGTARLSDGTVLPTHGSIPRETLLAIWQYWLEEAASDVFAVMNIGPSYGLGWGLFMAGLNASFRLKDKGISQHLASGKTQPELSVKSLANADQHPVDILTLYVVMGAVDTLDGLSKTRRSRYIREIESIAALCGKEELELITVRADRLKLSRKTKSSLEKKFTKQVPMFIPSTAHTTKSFKESIIGERLKDLMILDNLESPPIDMLVLPQNEMKSTARRVGAYIATAKLPAFGGKSVQDLETWDDPDEESAWRIANRLIANESVAGMGDDAQLLAGGVLAFYQKPEPKQYKKINRHLMKALDVSFECDPIWNPPAAPGFLDTRRLSRRSRHK